MDLDAKYLVSLDPEKLLSRFYKNAGLKVTEPPYGGWESEGVSGHIMGHYLSACAMMYASTGDNRFLDRTNYLITQLAACQKARKTGYVGAIPDEDKIFKQISDGDIRTTGFDLNGGWVPLYTLHKVFAGILDAYTYTKNPQAKEMAVKLGDWLFKTFNHLSEVQMQKVLACEQGGIKESIVNLYAITNDRKYLALAHKFDDEAVTDPLSQMKDQLSGLHANTQIPKIIGAVREYEFTGNRKDSTVASFFWDAVTKDHSYVTGGNSDGEHFDKPGKISGHLSDATTETCNTYNMLKLTQHLFTLNPSVAYADFYERALYNHILASQNSESGAVCYYLSLRQGTNKSYQSKYDSFTCCVGSGMENHAKYGEGIYYHNSNGLYVNLFIPSVLQWKEKGITLTQKTRFPESDTIRLHVKAAKPVETSFFIRYPGWAKAGITIKVNGKPWKFSNVPDSYVEVKRKWKDNDVVELVLPMQLYASPTPDDKEKIAIKYGPIVMAGLLSKDKTEQVPVMLAGNLPAESWIKATTDSLSPSFKTIGVGKPYDVELVPFYKINNERYAVYWDVFNRQQWKEEQTSYENHLKELADVEKRTIDVMALGEMQPERDHNFKGEKTSTWHYLDRNYRAADTGGWFSFDVKVSPDKPVALLCTYWGSDEDRVFEISVDGKLIKREKLTGKQPGRFYNEAYAIPQSLTKDKEMVNVKFSAVGGKNSGAVYGCKIIYNREQN